MIKKYKSRSDSKHEKGHPDFRQWLREGNISLLKAYVSMATNSAKTLISKGYNEIAEIKCNIHPEEPNQKMAWKVLFRLLRKDSRTLKCAKCRQENLIRLTVKDYENRLIKLDCGLTFVRGKLKLTDKINSKVKQEHKCDANPEHPLIIASPYDVNFKKKRCAFCNPRITYRKDFNFVKNFVEMDSDRIRTHGGNFVLLTSEREFEQELVKYDNDLKKCKLRINQKNCDIHNSFRISWEDFALRHRACSKCTRDAHSSYAHRFFQALLVAYNLKFIPEYSIRVNNQILRTDFYLPQINKHIEIDSALHKRASAFTKYSKQKLKEYQQRDAIKDDYLGKNLERVILYKQTSKGIFVDKPSSEQLIIVKEVFRKLYKQTFSKTPDLKVLEEKINDPDFFKNARVQAQINKLAALQGDHIVFVKSSHHISLINSEKQLFKCTHLNVEFEMMKYTVLEQPFFLCPVCVAKAKEDVSYAYPVNPNIVSLMVESLQEKHGHKIAFWNSDKPFDGSILYRSITPKMRIVNQSRAFYIPFNRLATRSTDSLLANAKDGKFDFKEIQRSRESRKRKTSVVAPLIENRKSKNAKSKKEYYRFYKAARLFTSNQRNGIKNSLSAKEVSELLPKYTHKNERAATVALAKFKDKIIPFFEGHPDFILLSKAEQYAGQDSPLLIYHHECKSYFFSEWAKIRKGLVCQGNTCFKKYFYQQAKPTNKKRPEQIMKIFRETNGGNYRPKDINEYKDMRTPITIIYRPTRAKFRASVDNFRRGKFRKPV